MKTIKLLILIMGCVYYTTLALVYILSKKHKINP